MNSYELGNLIRVSAVFTDFLTGMPQDPDVVELSIRDATGTLTTYLYGVDAIIIKDGVGLYHADLDVEAAGKWYYRWWATGNGQAAKENSFTIKGVVAIALHS